MNPVPSPGASQDASATAGKVWILRHFPCSCPPPGWPNAIIDAEGTYAAYPEHAGPLSIKCVFQGREVHQVHDARFAVNERSYLVLNAGQRYTSYSESKEKVEALTFFFNPEFVKKALRCLVTPDDSLLDGPANYWDQPLDFIEKLYPHDDVLTPLILRIHSAVRTGPLSEGWLEEQFYLLLERLLMVHRNLYPVIARLPAVRRTTRVEIYRRLHRAKDFIDSSLSETIDLSQISRIACFSSYHCLRLFKKVFHETPHQYLIRKRLERARELLLGTDLPISEICTAVGFESLGSFSHLFRNRCGVTPLQFRRDGSPRS